VATKINVIALDDEADSDVAAAVAEQIKAAVEAGDRVFGRHRYPELGQTAAAMTIYKDLSIVVITPTSLRRWGLTHQGYRIFLPGQRQQRPAGKDRGDYLVNKLGQKSVARRCITMTRDGIDLGKLVVAELAKLGAQVPYSQQVKVEQNRFADEVAKVKAAGVDSVYLRTAMRSSARICAPTCAMSAWAA